MTEDRPPPLWVEVLAYLNKRYGTEPFEIAFGALLFLGGLYWHFTDRLPPFLFTDAFLFGVGAFLTGVEARVFGRILDIVAIALAAIGFLTTALGL